MMESIKYCFVAFVLCACTKLPAPPVGTGNKVELTTFAATNITSESASAGGNITLDGGSYIIARGVCWSTYSNPTISNSKTIDGEGVGSFTSSLTLLTPNTTYYVRAYATNSYTTIYGDVKVFKTLAGLATITTNTATSITQTSAISGGSIASSGGATITQKGVCWSTTSNPTLSDSYTSNGSGTSSFSSSLTGLSPNVTYYVRAYATNSTGTAYGNSISFKTLAAAKPSVSSSTISSITQTTSIGGGNVTSDGGSPVTQRGVCWSAATTAPTVSDNKTLDGVGIGNFSSSLTNLIPSTTYYVRAYATNSAGTSYGTYKSFTTLSLSVPTLVNPASATSITKAIGSYINFSWNSVTGATGYEIVISKSSTFSGTLRTISQNGTIYTGATDINQGISSVTSFSILAGTSVNNGKWYWRVRALSGATVGAWSSTRYYNYTY